MAASLHGDVASAIGQQVEQMILQAKKDSEARVKHDLSQTRNQLQHMEGLIAELGERVVRCAHAHGAGARDPSQTVDQAFLSQNIAQLEQKWGSEVKALKQDLHRTILAHNHNSDLMRHHRDALDEARRRLDLHAQPKAEQVDAQIEKVDRMLRQGQAKQRALDALTDRLGLLEQQVAEVLPGGVMGAGAFPGMMPGMPRGMNPMMAQQAQPKKAGRGAQLGAPAGDLSGFNAEAPVFVPGRGMVLEGAAAGNGAGAAPAKAVGAAPGLSEGADEAAAEEEDDDEEAEEAEEGEEEDDTSAPPPGL